MKKKNRFVEFLKDIGIELFASMLCAIGLFNFADAAKLPLSGFSGIAMIINHFTKMPIGIATIIINIPVAILCYTKLGKTFFWRSLRCMTIYSLLIDYVAPLFPVYAGDRMLAAICTAVIAGIGFGIIYMRNSSTGGSDFITIAIKTAKPHLPLGIIAFAFETLTVIAGALVYADLDGMIYGILIAFLQGQVVDKLLYGANDGKLILIVTQDSRTVADAIFACTERGATLIDVKGAYQYEDKQMIMCACGKDQAYSIEQAVKSVSPASFTIIMNTCEVHGEGFGITRVAQPRVTPTPESIREAVAKLQAEQAARENQDPQN